MRGLDPIARQDALALILGTFPGKKSLAVREYYADGTNAFWSIIEQVLGSTIGLIYEQQIKLLAGSRIALWDVLRSAQRTGSSDSTIEWPGSKPNNFREFFQTHSKIEAIFFNGETAAALYQTLVAPHLLLEVGPPRMRLLPSTSGANTHMTRDQKLKAWREALRAVV